MPRKLPDRIDQWSGCAVVTDIASIGCRNVADGEFLATAQRPHQCGHSCGEHPWWHGPGVAKSTVYRHWATCDELIAAVFTNCAPIVACPDQTLDFEAALRVLAHQFLAAHRVPVTNSA